MLLSTIFINHIITLNQLYFSTSWKIFSTWFWSSSNVVASLFKERILSSFLMFFLHGTGISIWVSSFSSTMLQNPFKKPIMVGNVWLKNTTKGSKLKKYYYSYSDKNKPKIIIRYNFIYFSFQCGVIQQLKEVSRKVKYNT